MYSLPCTIFRPIVLTTCCKIEDPKPRAPNNVNPAGYINTFAEIIIKKTRIRVYTSR